MRITIFAAGSRGDVQPCLVLARGLQRAGYQVGLAAPENFASFVEEQGVTFHALHGDVQQIMASETGREFMQAGNANPIQSIRAMRTMLGRIAPRLAGDLLEACREAQALISLAVFAPFAKSVAEAHSIPLINVEPTPMLPTRLFPAAGWPVQRNLGGLHNRLSGFANLQLIWLWYRPFVNDFRKRLGLPPFAGSSFYRILASEPLLGAYSPAVIPFPGDWPASVHITGYWFAEAGPWRPSASLQKFLEAGEAPVYVGFGSMAGGNPEQFAQIVLEALEISGKRGLLLTGWGGLQTKSAPEHVFIAEFDPSSLAVSPHGGGRSPRRRGDHRRRAAGRRTHCGCALCGGPTLLGKTDQGPGGRAGTHPAAKN